MRGFVKVLLVILFIPILSACMASPLNMKEGIASLKMHDYRRAFIRLRPEAEKGSPDAQYAIGYMYYYGRGVVEDRQKGWYWIDLAAKAGQPDAIVAMKIITAIVHEKGA